MRYLFLFLTLALQLNVSGYNLHNPQKNHAQKTLTSENTNSSERSAVLWRYQGQYQDSETGLYYNRFRYYDPSIGNYISQDPIGLEGGNPTIYGYVKDVNSWVDIGGLNGIPSLPNTVILEMGNTKIIHNYADLLLEHADPIHFHVEVNGTSIGKIKADGTLLDGKLNADTKKLLSSKKNINKLRKAEKKIANYIRKVGKGKAGGRPFRAGSRGGHH